MNKYFALVSLCSVFILTGAGCQSAASKPSDYEIMTTANDRCLEPGHIAQFEKIFGKGNVGVVPFTYADGFRTEGNTCTYSGYVLADDTNYLVSVSTIADVDQKYFAWEKQAYDGAEILSKSETLFYKKLTILPQINFGKQRKQLYGWDVVSRVGDVTLSVSAVPQFADSDEKTVREVLDSILEAVLGS